MQNEPKWYYAQARQKLGPVSQDELQELAARGRLRPTDMVLEHGTVQWVAADTLGIFSPEAIPRAIPVTVDEVKAPPLPPPSQGGERGGPAPSQAPYQSARISGKPARP